MNSTDLYPLNRQQLAQKLGYKSYTALFYSKGAEEHIPLDKSTYIGREQRFMADVVDILRLKGLASKHNFNKAQHIATRLIKSPIGFVTVEAGVPIPEREKPVSWVETFDMLKVGQSIKVEAKTKNTLEHALTDANRELAPKKFTRRYFEQEGVVRVWRVE